MRLTPPPWLARLCESGPPDPILVRAVPVTAKADGKVQPNSATAQQWRDTVGIDFHEIVIETNAHKLMLVCADLTVTGAADSYTPFPNRRSR